ncbi:MAG: LysE family translocator [Venatoribacter sp.]
MTLSIWLTVVTICLLGAMSPGPSVALVLKHTLNSGRRQGLITAISHGTAVGIYALLSVLGLVAIIATSPLLFHGIQWAGAAYLAWLGVQGLRAQSQIVNANAPVSSSKDAARDGFLMAFLNPKAAVFFLALFSQVVTINTPFSAKLIYAITAMIVDMSWYMCVAWLFSRPLWLRLLSKHIGKVERAFGVILILLALQIVYSNL